MEDLLAGIDFTNTLYLNRLIAWMDGGSITLELVDKNAIEFTVEFCQIMLLKRYPHNNIPGSFLLNGIEIPIRSDEEQIVLDALARLQPSDKLLAEERHKSKQLPTYREMLNKQIAFVKSNKYLTIAKEMGRL